MTVELKPSGISFIGDIPAHWNVASVKRLYSIQLGKMLQNHAHGTDNIKTPYLKAKNVQWFTINPPVEQSMWTTPDEMVQFGVRNGDLLVCEGGEGGRCGIAQNIHFPCIIQNALHRVRPISDSSNEYLLYAIYAIATTGWLNAINNKATIAHFTNEKFGSLKIAVPPPAEQTAIVRFLNLETEKIESAIIAKEKTIVLLEEQKRGIINRAITRGLNSSVTLKPSESSFIGKIPQHWKIVRNKYLFECMKEINIGMKNANVLSLTLRGVVNNDPENPEGLVPRDYATYQIVRKDDIIFKLIDLENFQTSRVGLVHEDGIMSSAYIRFSPIIQKINVRFFYYQFYDLYMRRIFNQIGKGVRSTLGAPDLLSLPVCVPPLPEQNAIVKYINNTTIQIDAAVKYTSLEIALLREYRTRLVADAVTGKIDVRNFTSSSSKSKKRL